MNLYEYESSHADGRHFRYKMCKCVSIRWYVVHDNVSSSLFSNPFIAQTPGTHVYADVCHELVLAYPYHVQCSTSCGIEFTLTSIALQDFHGVLIQVGLSKHLQTCAMEQRSYLVTSSIIGEMRTVEVVTFCRWGGGAVNADWHWPPHTYSPLTLSKCLPLAVHGRYQFFLSNNIVCIKLCC